MNKERRAKINIAMAEILRLSGKIGDVMVDITEIKGDIEKVGNLVESVQEAEEEARDNIPENMQDSERYEKADAACDYLNSASDTLDELIEAIENLNEYFEETVGYLNNAKE